jgi:hypothetical protein
MASSGMLRRVALVRTDVSEEHSASFIRVTSVRRLLVPARYVHTTPTLHPLINAAQSTPEPSVKTRATRRNIPEDVIVQTTLASEQRT